MDSLQNKYSKQSDVFLWLSIAWGFVSLCTIIFYDEGLDKFFILWGFWLSLVQFFGLVLCIWAAGLAFKEKKKAMRIITLLILFGGLAVLRSEKGIEYGIWPRYYLAKLYYDNKVKNVLAAQTSQEATNICNTKCRITRDDEGNLRQVIFPLGTVGAIFGWSAFVYDPVGNVIQSAKAWRGDEGVAQKHRGRIYLGCSLTSATHLTGDWYFCTFWHD